MKIIVPNKKQSMSMANKSKLYLNKRPKSKDTLSNKHNIFDDLNATDKAMMKYVKKYLAHKSNQAGELIHEKEKLCQKTGDVRPSRSLNN